MTERSSTPISDTFTMIHGGSSNWCLFLVLFLHCGWSVDAFSFANIRSLQSRPRTGFSPSSSRAIPTTSRSGTILHAAKKVPGYRLPDLSQSAFPEIPDTGFDLVVIGSGPAGESAAVRAAQLGARVAIVEKKSTFGGPTGLTSKVRRGEGRERGKDVESGEGEENGNGEESEKLVALLLSVPLLYATSTATDDYHATATAPVTPFC